MRVWTLSMIALLLVACGETASTETKVKKQVATEEEQVTYLNEGTITFYGDKDTAVITFELADTPYEIQKGLMYRKTMPDSVGMLFKFPYEDMRSFWMKNTNIALDIIFVSADFEIVNIENDAQPYSEYSLPSTGPAQYVIEVNAGYSVQHGLKSGTKLAIKYKS